MTAFSVCVPSNSELLWMLIEEAFSARLVMLGKLPYESLSNMSPVGDPENPWDLSDRGSSMNSHKESGQASLEGSTNCGSYLEPPKESKEGQVSLLISLLSSFLPLPLFSAARY